VTVLYLIRHGESENNAFAAEATANDVDDPPRTADPGLTRIGHAQAACIAGHLARQRDKTDVRSGVVVEGYGIERLYCSPMLRALQTARPIAAALGLRPEIWMDVYEEGGIWLDPGDGRGPVGHSGLTRREIETDYPGFAIPDGITEAGWWNRPFEQREELVARAARVARGIRQRIVGCEQRLAVVSHGTFISLLIQHLVFGQYVPDMRFSNHNTAINRLDIDSDYLRLLYLNRIDHLPLDLIT